MNLTTKQLKQIIKEELAAVMEVAGEPQQSYAADQIDDRMSYADPRMVMIVFEDFIKEAKTKYPVASDGGPAMAKAQKELVNKRFGRLPNSMQFTIEAAIKASNVDQKMQQTMYRAFAEGDLKMFGKGFYGSDSYLGDVPFSKVKEMAKVILETLKRMGLRGMEDVIEPIDMTISYLKDMGNGALNHLFGKMNSLENKSRMVQ